MNFSISILTIPLLVKIITVISLQKLKDFVQFKKITHFYINTVFRDFKNNWNSDFCKLYQKYGPVMTIWIGPFPFVFIADTEMARQAFGQIELIGRPDFALGIHVQ